MIDLRGVYLGKLVTVILIAAGCAMIAHVVFGPSPVAGVAGFVWGIPFGFGVLYGWDKIYFKQVMKKYSTAPIPTYLLLNCEADAAEHPDAFELPTPEEYRLLDLPPRKVKLMFSNGDYTERMWVRVTEPVNTGQTPAPIGEYWGTLISQPALIAANAGDRVFFRKENVCAVWLDAEAQDLP